MALAPLAGGHSKTLTVGTMRGAVLANASLCQASVEERRVRNRAPFTPVSVDAGVILFLQLSFRGCMEGAVLFEHGFHLLDANLKF